MERYEKFVNQIANGLAKRNVIPFSNIEFKQSESGDKNEDRLFVILKGEDENSPMTMNIGLGLHIYDVYQDYVRGISLGDLLEQLETDMLQAMKTQNEMEMQQKMQDILEYDKIADRLIVYPLNIRELENKEDYVCKSVGDIALVVYCIINNTGYEQITLKVHKSLLKTWNKSEDEVYMQAMLNTYLLSGPRMYDLKKYMKSGESYQGEAFMNLLAAPPKFHVRTGRCISTVNKNNGAIAVFLPGVAQRLGALMKQGYYICFTSKHEAMVHSVELSDPDALREILRSTIDTATPKEDFLSYRLYKYDPAVGEIFCMDPFSLLS